MSILRSCAAIGDTDRKGTRLVGPESSPLRAVAEMLQEIFKRPAIFRSRTWRHRICIRR